MQHAVAALHQVGVLVLLVVGLVLVAHVAFAALHPADDREGQAAVLGQGYRHRAAQAGPCGFAGLRVQRAGGVVGDGDAAALQFQRADAGIVVGQRGGRGLRPCVAVVEGFAAVDAPRLAVAHEGHQMSRLQLDNIRVDVAVALGHHDHPPRLALVIRNAERRGVAGKAIDRIGAEPVCEDPAPVGQDLDGLTAEGAFFGEDGGVVAPRLAAVGGFLAADDGGVLHVVLAGLPIQLGGVHRPDGVVGAVKQRGVLLAAGGVFGNIHRGQPRRAVVRQAGADDVNIGAALIRTGKPAAQQVAVGQLYHGGGVGGGKTAGGQQRLQRAHLFVLIDRAVPRQAGQFYIGHVVSSVFSQRFVLPARSKDLLDRSRRIS